MGGTGRNLTACGRIGWTNPFVSSPMQLHLVPLKPMDMIDKLPQFGEDVGRPQDGYDLGNPPFFAVELRELWHQGEHMVRYSRGPRSLE